MAVRIRMKRMGRRHRPFFRICAVDSRSPRDGRVIEELGHYDPMVRETDARAVLRNERIDYWLGVGAQPSEKVAVLIRKYGSNGSHLEQQQAALQRLAAAKPQAPPPMVVPRKREEAPPAEATAEPQEQAAQPQAQEQAAQPQEQAAEPTTGEPEPAAESSQ